MENMKATLKRTARGGLVCALIVAAALSVAQLLGSAAIGLGGPQSRAEASLKAHVVLEPTARLETVQALERDLQTMDGVEQVVRRSGAANLAVLRRDLGEELPGLSASMLPTTLTVHLSRPASDLPALHEPLKALEARPEVDGVEVGRPEVAKLSAALGPARGMMGLLALLALLGAIAAVSSVQSADVFRRRESIEVLRLIGAEEHHITRPLYQQGLVSGLLGGGLAALVAVGAQQVLEGPAAAALVLPYASMWVAPVMVLGGVAVAWMGATLCARRAVRAVEGVE